MPFWVCYYHIVWTTRNREPLITPQTEPVLFKAVETKSSEFNAPVLAVNGVADHIHIAVCIPPKIAVSDWVGNVKGASSHAVNTAFSNLPTQFRWQGSYGVLSFGVKNLDMVRDYILHQKQHHANNSLYDYLERADD